jgi:hypothetical protein
MATTARNDPETPEAPTLVAPAAPSEARRSAQKEIDLVALAGKLYELLQKEARIERERLGRR